MERETRIYRGKKQYKYEANIDGVGYRIIWLNQDEQDLIEKALFELPASPHVDGSPDEIREAQNEMVKHVLTLAWQRQEIDEIPGGCSTLAGIFIIIFFSISLIISLIVI